MRNNWSESVLLSPIFQELIWQARNCHMTKIRANNANKMSEKYYNHRRVLAKKRIVKI